MAKFQVLRIDQVLRPASGPFGCDEIFARNHGDDNTLPFHLQMSSERTRILKPVHTLENVYPNGRIPHPKDFVRPDALQIEQCCLATVPNTHWDSQVYHYTLPRLYLERGRVYWTGTGIYDSLFSLSHLLYAWAMGCAGETGVNLLGFVFLGLLTTSLMAVVHEASEGGPGQNVVLALVASSPLLLAQADGGLTDPPAAAYVAAMMAGTPSRGSWIWGLAAILTRLNAGVAVGLWILATGRRRVVAFVVLAGLLPWVAFNLLNHHAPWYPFGTFLRGLPVRHVPIQVRSTALHSRSR